MATNLTRKKVKEERKGGGQGGCGFGGGKEREVREIYEGGKRRIHRKGLITTYWRREGGEEIRKESALGGIGGGSRKRYRTVCSNEAGEGKKASMGDIFHKSLSETERMNGGDWRLCGYTGEKKEIYVFRVNFGGGAGGVERRNRTKTICLGSCGKKKVREATELLGKQGSGVGGKEDGAKRLHQGFGVKTKREEKRAGSKPLWCKRGDKALLKAVWSPCESPKKQGLKGGGGREMVSSTVGEKPWGGSCGAPVPLLH